MKIETSKKALRIVSWFNIIAAVLLTIFGLFMFTQQNNEMIQEISKSMNMTELKNIPLTTFVGSIFLASAIATALEAWLLRRAAKDGKKSTFIIIITISFMMASFYSLNNITFGKSFFMNFIYFFKIMICFKVINCC